MVNKIKQTKLEFNKTQKEILRYLKSRSTLVKTKEIDKKTSVGYSATLDNLNKLRDMKIIERFKNPYHIKDGWGPDNYWQTDDMLTKSDWNKINKALRKR